MWRHIGIGALLMMIAVARAAAQNEPPQIADCPPQNTVCVGKTYQPATENLSIMSPPASNKIADPEAAKALGVKISFIFSDYLRAWRLSAMDKICAGTDCLYYRKVCTSSSCDYAYGNPTPWYGTGMVPLGRNLLVPGTMTISYTTQDALRAAEENVFLVLGRDGSKSFVPLSELKIASDPGSPYCKQGSQEPGC